LNSPGECWDYRRTPPCPDLVSNSLYL
jgi:hypothetical protein